MAGTVLADDPTPAPSPEPGPEPSPEPQPTSGPVPAPTGSPTPQPPATTPPGSPPATTHPPGSPPAVPSPSSPPVKPPARSGPRAKISNPTMERPDAVGEAGTGVLNVNTDDVWDAASAVKRCANDFGKRTENALDTLTGTGNMAGIDLVATFFAGCYDPLADQVGMAGHDLVEALAGVALGLVASANNFSKADHQSSVGQSGQPETQPRPAVIDIPRTRPAPASGGAYLDLTGDTTGFLLHAVPRSLEGLAALVPTGHQDRLLTAASAWRQIAEDAGQLSLQLNSAIDQITISDSAQAKLAGRGVPNPSGTIGSWQDAMRQFVSRIWGSRPWLASSGTSSAPLEIMGECAAALGNGCIELANAIDVTRSKLEHRMGDLAFAVLLEIVFSETGPLDILVGAIIDSKMIEDCIQILYANYWQPVDRLYDAWVKGGLRGKLEFAVKMMPSLAAMEAQADSVGDRALHDFQYPGLLATNSGAIKANRFKSVPPGSVYPVDLATMEGVGSGNFHAHTIAKHVGQTDAQLQQRLADQSTIPAASTFTSEGAAQNFVQADINHNEAAIKAWLRTQSATPRSFTYTPSGHIATGLTLTRNGSRVQGAYSVRVVLKYMPGLNPNFIVLTAYPE